MDQSEPELLCRAFCASSRSSATGATARAAAPSAGSARDTRLDAFAATRVLQESGGLTLIPTSPPCCSQLVEVTAAVVFCCVSWCDYILASPKASETSVNVTCALDPGTYSGTYSTRYLPYPVVALQHPTIWHVVQETTTLSRIATDPRLMRRNCDDPQGSSLTTKL